jgi:hypothetical protein
LSEYRENFQEVAVPRQLPYKPVTTYNPIPASNEIPSAAHWKSEHDHQYTKKVSERDGPFNYHTLRSQMFDPSRQSPIHFAWQSKDDIGVPLSEYREQYHKLDLPVRESVRPTVKKTTSAVPYAIDFIPKNDWKSEHDYQYIKKKANVEDDFYHTKRKEENQKAPSFFAWKRQANTLGKTSLVKSATYTPQA